MTLPSFNREKLLALQAARKIATPASENSNPSPEAFVPRYFTSKGLPLNERQTAAVDLAAERKPFCLIGAAGTGKTTTLREVVIALSKTLPPGTTLSDSIILCAFTRRAVANARRALGDLDSSFGKTIHKALKYRKFKEEYFDENGELRTKFFWSPSITELSPNRDVKLIIVEEASMVSYEDLYRELRLGFPEATFIFVGDLNQLKPVFGQSVLGFKLSTLPVIELTEVYRQAMDSPIVAFQHNFTLKGKVPTTKELQDIALAAQGLRFIPIIRRQENPIDCAYRIFHNFLLPEMRKGLFLPEEDMILLPNNNKMGQLTFNAFIAQELSMQRGDPTWEIDCGVGKRYLAVGDTVQADKRDGKIVDIKRNPEYEGNATHSPSTQLDRFGKFHGSKKVDLTLLEYAGDPLVGERALKKTMETLNAAITGDSAGEGEERKRQASHIVSIKWLDSEEEEEPAELSTVGEVSNISLNYAMTIHRSQGSEWRRVVLILHHSAAGMLCRELFYTGMTRARELLDVFYSPESSLGKGDATTTRCIRNASIPGKTWQEKAVHFKGKVESLNWIDQEDLEKLT